MGDPRRITNKYQGPMHPWNKERIEREKTLNYTYGLVNKKELWKVESKLKTFKDNAKKLIAKTGPQAEKELQQLFKRLQRYGLVGAEATPDDVLSIKTEQLLNRRLQTLVHQRQLAHTAKQARQFITHGHITVNGKKITVPSYLVTILEESTIGYAQGSQLNSQEHPERPQPKPEKQEAPKKKQPKKAEAAPTTEPATAETTPKKKQKKAAPETKPQAAPQPATPANEAKEEAP